MIEQVSTAITFVFFYYDATNDCGKTGLTVTVDVRRVSDTTELVTAANATEIGDGFYKYTLAAGSTGTESGYVAVAKTNDTDVSQRHIPAMWTVGVAGVEDLDAAVSTRSTVTTAQVNTECDTALSDYDPPTKTEMDSGFAALNDPTVSAIATAVGQRAIPDSYAADGSQPTIEQALLMIVQFLQERVVSGTTVTVRKPDGSTTAMTFTLDDGSDPTSITRSG